VIRCEGEDIAPVVHRDAELLGLGLGEGSMFAENSRGLLVQHDPSVLMGLGVLLEPLAVLAFPDRALDDDDAVVELEVVPVERAEFATTCAPRSRAGLPPGQLVVPAWLSAWTAS
jgi:hypothetical protein